MYLVGDNVLSKSNKGTQPFSIFIYMFPISLFISNILLLFEAKGIRSVSSLVSPLQIMQRRSTIFKSTRYIYGYFISKLFGKITSQKYFLTSDWIMF